MEASEKLSPTRAPDEDPTLARLEEAVARTDEKVRSLVSEHPVLTLLGAAAIGYVAGRLIAR